MDSYSESRFRSTVDRALQTIRTVLENNRSPALPASINHTYDDKYLLAELLANTALAAQVNSLEFIGLSAKNIDTILEWGQNRSVTLRYKAERKCDFVREHTYERESAEHVKVTSGFLGDKTTTTKVVTKVTDYIWSVKTHYEIVAFQGNNVENKILLQQRDGEASTKTSTKTTPYPAVSVFPNIDLNIGFLISHINEKRKIVFHIDRSNKKCRTPRRNPEITAALKYFNSYYDWCGSVNNSFLSEIFPLHGSHSWDLSRINEDKLFVPVLALFDSSEAKKLNKGGASQSLIALSERETGACMNVNDINAFLDEQRRAINEKFRGPNSDLRAQLPEAKTTGIISIQEAMIVCVNLNARSCCVAFSDGVDYIEEMLRTQLIAAIGKEVTPVDFTNYMIYHNRKMFRDEYEPVPFSWAVRLPDHYPEGLVSIDVALSDGSIEEPINTVVRTRKATVPMFFNINAATEIEFYGDRHIHSYVSHQFSGQSGQSLSLTARARQFSSFIMLVGKIITHNRFDPQAAMIVQNKDEFKIPLTFETIPTPKQFRDAIESLSPEQQRFAQAIRSMQLASTLFGIVVIQIKPQLEKLLRLPEDSLTKEIRMNQDLMNIFIKYQIPSDLISYTPNEEKEDTRYEKIEKVKQHMAAMQRMLDGKKDEESIKRAEELAMAALKPIPQKHVPVPSRPPRPGGIAMPTTTAVNSINFSGGPIPCPSPMPVQSAPMRSMVPSSPPMVHSSSSPNTNANLAPTPKSLASPVTLSSRADTGSAQPLRKAKADASSFSAPQEMKMKKAAPTPEKSLTKIAPSTTQSESTAKPTVSVEASKPASKDQAREESKPADPQQEKRIEKSSSSSRDRVEGEDYTQIPGELDRKMEALDEDGALRPTIIDLGKVWHKKSQATLLSPVAEKTLNIKDQEEERNKAFDLLDALSRSGCLAFDHAALHVVMASTHCFDKTLLNTVVQDNINPIEKMESSTLIIATTIHQSPAEELVRPDVLERVATYSPLLFGSVHADDDEEKVKAIEDNKEVDTVISEKSSKKEKI